MLGGVGAAALVGRRTRAARAERAELHYDDGSSVALPGAAVGGARLVGLARELIAAAGR
ncbi:MAG: hypothetical protein ICV59_00970 [Thermoleophilia bacterium]|nr:hypothetical protein [Thermoleophilia bacterium]